jgi:hypothetical protein
MHRFLYNRCRVSARARESDRGRERAGREGGRVGGRREGGRERERERERERGKGERIFLQKSKHAQCLHDEAQCGRFELPMCEALSYQCTVGGLKLLVSCLHDEVPFGRSCLACRRSSQRQAHTQLLECFQRQRPKDLKAEYVHVYRHVYYRYC